MARSVSLRVANTAPPVPYWTTFPSSCTARVSLVPDPTSPVAKGTAPEPVYMTRLPSLCIVRRLLLPEPAVLLLHVAPDGPYSTRLPSVCMVSLYAPCGAARE